MQMQIQIHRSYIHRHGYHETWDMLPTDGPLPGKCKLRHWQIRSNSQGFLRSARLPDGANESVTVFAVCLGFNVKRHPHRDCKGFMRVKPCWRRAEGVGADFTGSEVQNWEVKVLE